MKKLIISISVVLIFGHFIEIDGQGIESIRAHSGFTYSNLEWDYDTENPQYYLQYGNQKAFGYCSSIEVEYYRKKYFTLVSGLGFYQKGGKDSYRVDSDFDYLNFDTQIKFQNNIGSLSPFIVVGPRVDYMLYHSRDFDLYERDASLNRFNFGAKYGFGLEYVREHLLVGFRWQNNLNLNPIIVNNGESILPEFTTWDKTMTFSLFFGVKLND